jgi:hypothetical protein
VRNARAAGEVVLARAMRRHSYAVRELSPNMRPPILKAYLDRFASEVQRFSPYRRGHRWKHSTIWRCATRSSNCSHWTGLDTAPKRLRDDKTPIRRAVESGWLAKHTQLSRRAQILLGRCSP